MVFSSALLVPILVFMGCGAVAGLLAGLLGVGGGIVIVPMLDIVFEWLHYPPELIHQLALGTSLATIVITSISSSRAHAKRGAVHWDIFAKITPGILVGTFCGGLVATHMPTTFPAPGAPWAWARSSAAFRASSALAAARCLCRS